MTIKLPFVFAISFVHSDEQNAQLQRLFFCPAQSVRLVAIMEKRTSNDKRKRRRGDIPRALQCPHQGAKNSTSMSFSSLTEAAKFLAVRSITSDSARTPAIKVVAARPTRAIAEEIRMFV